MFLLQAHKSREVCWRGREGGRGRSALQMLLPVGGRRGKIVSEIIASLPSVIIREEFIRCLRSVPTC